MADAGSMKNLNMEAVRRALRDSGTMSKNALALATGLSFPTVGRTVELLVGSGELVEMGAASSTGGRCAQLYAVNPIYVVTLAFRLEGLELRWFVSDQQGGRLDTGSERCEDGALATLDGIITRVHEKYPQLGAIALGFAGTVRCGTVTEAFGYDELKGVDVRAHIEKLSGLPVAVEGDMVAVSTGYWENCARRPKAVVCVYLGKQGSGGGIVIDGVVWHGVAEFAGELHYLPIYDDHIEYAKSNFAGVDMVDYCSKLARSYAALVNPERIVFYDDPLISGRLDDIRRECARHLPLQAIPQLEISSDFDRDYERGLAALADRLLGAKDAQLF